MARLVDQENWRLWRGRLRRFDASDVTVTKFCADERVSVASFYQWKKRLAAERASRRSQAFVPVQVTPAAVATIEIHLPNGTRVSLPSGDVEMLRVAIETVVRACGDTRQSNSTEVEAC